MTLTQQEINDMIDLHEIWLKDKTKGKQLVLRGDMSNISFAGRDLTEADLEWLMGSNIDFTSTILSYANLSASNICCSKFNKAVMSNTIADDSTFLDSYFIGAYCSRMSLVRSSVLRCDFSESSLNGAIMLEGEFLDNITRDADLRGMAYSK